MSKISKSTKQNRDLPCKEY